MPYLNSEEKKRLEEFPRLTGSIIEMGRNCKTPGDLNYFITRLIQGYFKSNGGRYQQINDIIGALEGAKLEFYRRIGKPYEEKKAMENGDVY